MFQHVVLPFLAILALGAMDHHARHGIPAWLVNLGWDSCVLALGAAPAVFLSANAAGLFETQINAVYWGFAYALLCIFIAGTFLSRLRSVRYAHDGHAIAALAVGGALLGVLIYVGTYATPAEAQQTGRHVTASSVSSH